MGKKIPQEVEKVRLDLSDRLWHFTRRDGNPLDTLNAILSSGHVRGSSDKFCPDAAVCFTEMPITEAIRQSNLLDELSYNRFSDYGIGFLKTWIFGKGGLPVIYQPDIMREQLPKSMRWRHCVLDYEKGLDFTWQREWRFPGEKFSFTQDDDLIAVVRTRDEALEHLSEVEVDFERGEYFETAIWSYVTHDRLRKAKSPRDVEVLRVKQG